MTYVSVGHSLEYRSIYAHTYVRMCVRMCMHTSIDAYEHAHLYGPYYSIIGSRAVIIIVMTIIMRYLCPKNRHVIVMFTYYLGMCVRARTHLIDRFGNC